MIVQKIHSKYILKELFSFVSDKKKLKLIKGNSFLHKKLDITIKDYQILFFQNKMYNYDCIFVFDYYEKFLNEYESIIENQDDLDDIFFDSLSKIQNFDLNILDKQFNLIITNPNFQNNIRIKLENLIVENLPKIILIKNNQLIDKAMKVFTQIFILNSRNGTINKSQLNNLFKNDMKNIISYDDDYVFSNYDTDNDGLLRFIDFSNFLFDLIKKDINAIWKFLNLLGYNNLLDNSNNNDINYFLNHMEEFDIKSNSVYFYLNQLSKIKIHKLCLIDDINKDFILFFNNKQVFQNIKNITISNFNLYKLIKLKIICTNVEEITLNSFDEIQYNFNDLLDIFPNIKIFNIYMNADFNLFDLLNNLKNCELNSLKIVIYNIGYNFNYGINNEIIFNKIRNLEIDIDEGYNINYFLFKFFNKIKLPTLKEYILHFDLNQFNEQKLKFNNNDFSIINKFLIETLNKKNKFDLKKFFNLPNELKNIRFLHLDLRDFVFIYKNKREKKYLFKFELNNINSFKKYYSNFDLSIDQNEIIKYKKIDIKGIKYGSKLDINEIIEKGNINICDIYFNINQKQYFIKSFKNLRSIYSEDEIQKKDFLMIMNLLDNQKDLDNLKYINISLGDIDISILSKIIKKCKNLKSLKLILHPNNFYQNIIDFLKLIESSKKLQIINIISKINRNIILKNILNDFPIIKEKLKYYYKEFIIGNESIILREKKKNNYFHFNIKCIYDIKNNIIGKNIIFKNPLTTVKKMFSNCFPLIYLNLLNFETKNINDMSGMFYDCSSLTSLNLSNFNTENVKDMSYMFYNCSSLISLDLSCFLTNNVQNMSGMFYDCSLLTSLNLSNFNTENVKDMSYMFYNCSSLISLDLSCFLTNNVQDMNNMFSNCSSLISLNLSNFNTENVKNIKSMFYKCPSLTSLDLSNINIINIDDLSGLFSNCSLLNSLNLTNFKSNNALYINCMFSNCSSLISLDLSNFNSKNVINMNNMFSKCSSLSSLNISNFNTDNVEDMSWMFYKCSSLNSLNLSNFKTNKVNNMSFMFYKCSSIKSLNLSNFNTNKVNNMTRMFSHCSSLNSLNLSNFTTKKVNNMSYMFYKCSSLQSLNLFNFNTINIGDMSNLNNMFHGISNKTTIISNDFILDNLINKLKNKK